jgi:hypothetical protein
MSAFRRQSSRIFDPGNFFEQPVPGWMARHATNAHARRPLIRRGRYIELVLLFGFNGRLQK